MQPDDELDALLGEQIAYYRARAAEYDATMPVDDAARAALAAALEAFAPRGHVLELACGTGLWTALLVRHAERVTAVDASPEMLARNRARVGSPRVRYVQADVFAWSPRERYDVAFFSAWLSHVPPQRFDAFWALVAECLAPGGRVFAIDELPAASADEHMLAGGPAPTVERTLRTGARYRAVKVPYEPEPLRRRLAALGWQVEIRPVGARFFYAVGVHGGSRRARAAVAG